MKIVNQPVGTVFPMKVTHGCGAVLELDGTDVEEGHQSGCKGKNYFTTYYWMYTCPCCGKLGMENQ